MRPVSDGNSTRGAIHVTLWIAQLVLFAVFAVTGLMKVTMSIDRLAPIMSWVTETPLELVRFIGVAELAGALGVLLPSVTRVYPRLTVLAALGLAAVMALATAVHLGAGEPARAVVPVVLGALAGFVVWGRRGPASIPPREASRVSIRPQLRPRS